MSQRAEELVDAADRIFEDGKPRPRARVAALIDAELRKERERCAERAVAFETKFTKSLNPVITERYMQDLCAAILSEED